MTRVDVLGVGFDPMTMDEAVQRGLVKAEKPKKKRAKAPLSPELSELQDKIRLKTGLKSTLTGSIKKGKIVLQYGSREELMDAGAACVADTPQDLLAFFHGEKELN